MEKTIKLPKHLDYKKVDIDGAPDITLWTEMSRKDYLYLCRARDEGEDRAFSYWRIALFVGGSVNLGNIQYYVHTISVDTSKYSYDDNYSSKYDEVQFIEIPCVFFRGDAIPYTGTVVGFYKDGSCAVIPSGETAITKIEASKVKYSSDILEME